MVNTPRKELDNLREELKNETPEALHTMLPEKEDKSKAKETFLCRKGKRTPICPPTCSGTAYQDYFVGLNFTTDAVTNYTLIDAELQQILNPPKQKQRRRPVCKKCGKPRKGHKKGQCSDVS